MNLDQLQEFLTRGRKAQQAVDQAIEEATAPQDEPKPAPQGETKEMRRRLNLCLITTAAWVLSAVWTATL